MKRLTAIIIMLAIMITASTGATFAASTGIKYNTAKTSRGYVTKFYSDGRYVGKVTTAQRVPVKIVKSSKLTTKQLTRRRDKYILVETINGECIDNKGNGRTSAGHYISYKRIKGHRKGVKYTTFAVYGNNNSVDDITIRIDIKK